MVTDHYQCLRYLATADELARYLHGRGVTLLGIDSLPGSAHLETMTMPRRVCFLFGQERLGASECAKGVTGFEVKSLVVGGANGSRHQSAYARRSVATKRCNHDCRDHIRSGTT